VLLIIFAKAPVVGKVKTRLTASISPEDAAALHEAMVSQVGRTMAPLNPELHTDIETSAWPQLAPRRLQCIGDLGERLLHAAHRDQPVLVIGSDAPDLPLAHVTSLMQAEADVAFGPASDGGYWGILFHRTHPQMFRDVRWSSPQTLADCIAAAQACGLSTAVGPTWHDVDEPADLARLLRSVAPHTPVGEWLAARPQILHQLSQPSIH
jgi:uncharacterized protein